MNFLALDLTNEIHYIVVRFFGKEYSLEFSENNRSQKNDWNKKIDKIYNKIPNFDLKEIDANVYAAGPVHIQAPDWHIRFLAPSSTSTILLFMQYQI